MGSMSSSAGQLQIATAWLPLRPDSAVPGRAVEGIGLIKDIEKLGSSSGRTSAKIVIKDCGELKTKDT